MSGDEIRRLRERLGLDRDELAKTLRSAIGGTYTGETISRWERGRAPSKKVSAFLDELALSDGLTGRPAASSTGELEPDDLPLDDVPAGDTAPGAPRLPERSPAVGGSNTYQRACEELFELVATGIGMVGAAIGNDALVADGAIIAGDKQALGQAWGRLAEQNETFRRMLVGMTEGGVWLQVALVTGTTVSKCWQSHQQYAAYLAGRNGGAPLDEPVGEPVAA